MDLIENVAAFSARFAKWNGNETLSNYPFVENTHAPFTPARRALPMLNLALISSAAICAPPGVAAPAIDCTSAITPILIGSPDCA